MLRISLSLLALFAFHPDLSDENGPYTTDKSRWEFYLELSRKWCPDAWVILSAEKDWQTYVKYASGASTEEKLIENFNTVVHETCHDFQYEIASSEGEMHAYYIGGDEKIVVSSPDIFNSRELNKFVPESLQKKIMRYSTYVGDGSNICSQKHGFPGLLDEFAAYYHGTLASAQMKKWFEKKGYKDPAPWVKKYVVQYGSTVTAFFEFRLFLAWYLQYAKKYHPDDYETLRSDKNLRKAFTLLYDRYEKLALAYEPELYELESQLRAAGNQVKVEEKYFQIITAKGSTGQGDYLDEIHQLNQWFTPAMKEILIQFRLENAG